MSASFLRASMKINPASEILALHGTPLPYLFSLLSASVDPIKVRNSILRCESQGTPVNPWDCSLRSLQRVFPRAAIQTRQARIVACAILRGLLVDRRIRARIHSIRASQKPIQPQFSL
jgi:hypothetical protein